MNPAPATVSVMVPTRNAEGSIRPCLESVTGQSYRSIELIVVDSYSSDRTGAIAKEYGRLISLDSGMTRARIEGAKAATGSYILNLDADQRDCIPMRSSKPWIRARKLSQ